MRTPEWKYFETGGGKVNQPELELSIHGRFSGCSY